MQFEKATAEAETRIGQLYDIFEQATFDTNWKQPYNKPKLAHILHTNTQEDKDTCKLFVDFMFTL